MIHTTHAVFAAALTEVILASEHAPITWQAVATAAVAYAVAPVPDIDQPESWVSRHLPGASIVSMFVRHRTLTHSLLASLLLYLVLFGLGFHIPQWLATGIVVGWVSHWLIDLVNPMGVQLFYPLPWWVKPPVPWLAIGVESAGETVIRVALTAFVLIFALAYLLLHAPVEVQRAAAHLLPAARRLVGAVTWPWLGACCRFLHLT
ncbi:metal-dependent hydrolase [Alicyclobacillus mali (ex Roth et al. 2021)]|uniref:metal-dependent hydrolase n=1 Tax=Alicyclobacillus mali (ex Roth et al. 2021) TaxID=1123961 RepID=UPI001E5C7DEE|nr:metal-dependent hydrolase [Alicyclobacillus mali (ex Roth et al. 2021)]